ncbi:MAG: hypothetical protein WKF96_11755 [Solirubrobacteraceae bacterium]
MWQDTMGLTDQASVLPTLELLQRMRSIDEFVHRHAYGYAEFESYIRARVRDPRARSYGTIYLAFHGTEDGLSVGNETLALDQLADLVGSLPGGVVHLGSCSVLRGDRDGARRFLRSTGADVLSGYESDVEWLDSAALDLAWLGYLAYYSRPGDAVRYFRRRYESSIKHLSWEAVRSTP